jgi:predicted Zn-dependent protease
MFWWFARPPLHERLFAEHFTPEPGLPVTMGATDDPAFADAMVYYKEGRYAEAGSRWAPLLAQEPTNDTLLFYTAMIELANGETTGAVTKLTTVSEGASIFRRRARWYLFLAYVQHDRPGEARALQVEKDSVYGERATFILSQLGE